MCITYFYSVWSVFRAISVAFYFLWPSLYSSPKPTEIVIHTASQVNLFIFSSPYFELFCTIVIFRPIQTPITTRLMLSEKRFRPDTNMARTDKAGSQQRTAVSPFLGLVSTVKRRYVWPVKSVYFIQRANVRNYKMTRSPVQVRDFKLTCRSYVGSVYRMRSLAVSDFFN